MIDLPFLRHATDIIGDTDRGLSGAAIVAHCSSFAVKYNVRIRFSEYPWKMGSVANKRTALYENLKCFSSDQQFEMLKHFCELPIFNENIDVQNLKLMLIQRYGQHDKSLEATDFMLISETKHWLSTYPDVLELYNSALGKYNTRTLERNCLDDLRLALELILKKLLRNSKSLENQINIVGSKLKDNGVSTELRNLIHSILKFYCDYQNTYVKHNDRVDANEVKYLIEITSFLIRFLSDQLAK